MKRHYLRTGEYLAIDPASVRRDDAGFYLIVGPDAPPNERRGSVCIVYVRGALTQFKDEGGDSYEAIVERVQCGLDADPKPSVILFCVSSPGGVVAGLNETVKKLQAMSKASGIEFVAFVGEMAASAAMAICCASSRVLAPPSAVVGSIGTISTMCSQARADEQMGLDYRLITSGKRKADGHPHAPITDDAVRAEAARVNELAEQFFVIASKSRGIPVKKIRSLEAAIYLGEEAEAIGLVDEVVSLDDAIYGLDRSETPPPSEVAPNNGNQTDRRAKEKPLDNAEAVTSTLTADNVSSPTEPVMLVKLAALIKRTEAAIASETDPKKRSALTAKLAAYQATKAEMDDDDGGGDGDGDGDGDDKAKKAAKAAKQAAKKAEAAKHRAKAAEHKQKAAEYEEAAKKAEEDDEEDDEEEDEAEAAARIAEIHARIEGATTTALSEGAAAAVASQAAVTQGALARIEALEKDTAARNRNAMIDEAVAARRITKAEATTLRKKSDTFVLDFLEMRPKALVHTTEEHIEQPGNTAAGDIPSAVKAMVEQGIEAQGLTGKKAEEYREASYTAHRKAMANGAGAY